MTHISTTCQNEFNFEKEKDLATHGFEIYLASQGAIAKIYKL